MNSRNTFIGFDSLQETITGNKLPLTYFDNAATTLSFKSSLDVFGNTLSSYANTHSHNSFNSRASKKILLEAIETVFDFFDTPEENFEVIFCGNGATAGLQYWGELLENLFPHKSIVLVSEMEHVSNDVLHRPLASSVIHAPLNGNGMNSGAVDLEKLEELLLKHRDNIRYVALTAMSNVTGIINPIEEVSAICKKMEIPLMLDIAQFAAHVPLSIRQLLVKGRVDGVVFSGHKIYAPGSPGVLIINRKFLKKSIKLGGGTVKTSSIYHAELFDDDFAVHHPGTVNLPAISLLCNALFEMKKIGMESVFRHHLKLTNHIHRALSELDDIIIYGASENVLRLSCIPFNIKDVPPDILACYLNDYYNISVRSGCFCAHSYVHKMQIDEHLSRDISGLSDIEAESLVSRFKGMVRISIGIYNSFEDADFLISAIREFVLNKNLYISKYIEIGNGKYKHCLLASNY